MYGAAECAFRDRRCTSLPHLTPSASSNAIWMAAAEPAADSRADCTTSRYKFGRVSGATSLGTAVIDAVFEPGMSVRATDPLSGSDGATLADAVDDEDDDVGVLFG